MKNYQNLNTKDIYILLKAIQEVAKETYESESERFLNELLKTPEKQYRSVYGLLHTRTNAAKTTKVYTEEEQKEVDKINAQIAKLEAQKNKLGTKVETRASYKSLVVDLEQTAKNDAFEILKEITNIIDSKTLTNAINKASKTARIK